MIGKLKTLGAAAVIALAPLAASAATIHGQIDIGGLVNLPGSNFSAAGNVDLVQGTSTVQQATGTFDAEGVGFLDLVALTDIDFTTPGAIWSVGGFSFVATGFSSIVDGVTKSFKAVGIVSHASYDDSEGALSFTTQNGDTQVSFSSTTVVPVPAAGFLLVGALGALGVARRRKKAA